MRRGRLGGRGADCGKESETGLFWESAYLVLDFGLPDMPPTEPDMSEPVRCDACELAARTRFGQYPPDRV